MTSSSPEAGVGARPIPFASRELRTGSWTRLGGSAVLGDPVTEHTLAGLVATAQSAARAQGYAVGWAEGRRAAELKATELTDALLEEHRVEDHRREAQHRAAVDALVEAAARLDASVAAVCARVESHTTEVAVGLTEQLLGHELSVAASPGLDAVRRGLALLPPAPVVRIRVSPEEASSPALAELAGTAVVVADATLGRGDAVVETDESVVDVRISAAMERVREVLQP